MKLLLRILIFIILLAPSLFSQWMSTPDFKDHSRKGIDFVYNLEFDKAQNEFSYLASTYPSHPAGKFFLAMIDWWKILINIDDESHDEEFIKKLDPVIDLCDSLLDVNDNDVIALFFKGGSLGFRGRLRANRGSWIKAANDGRLALPIVQRAYKIAPDNFDILLGIGIYNYYAFAIPERYPIVKPAMIFFPKGDKVKGIQQLQEASQKSEYAAVEASYFLLQLYYVYEHQYEKSLELAVSLHKRFPGNVLFHRYAGRSYIVTGKWEEALVEFNEILRRCDASYTGYSEQTRREAKYFLGLYYMEKKKYEDALQCFYQCDELSRKLDKKDYSGFMTMANLKVGMIYDLQQKRSYAVQQYHKVQQLKKFEDSYEQAERYLKTPYKQ